MRYEKVIKDLEKVYNKLVKQAEEGYIGGETECRENCDAVWNTICFLKDNLSGKPVIKRSNVRFYWYECPACGQELDCTSYYHPQYCPFCGQKLDWTTIQEKQE